MNITGNPAILSAVIELDQAYFPEPWTLNEWHHINWNHYRLIPFIKDEVLRGFALLGLVPGDDTAHLYKILLHPDCQGLGLAGVFWKDILSEMKNSNIRSIYLEVNTKNAQAITFYEKQGFKLIRTNKAFYSSGEDALIMTLTL